MPWRVPWDIHLASFCFLGSSILCTRHSSSAPTHFCQRAGETLGKKAQRIKCRGKFTLKKVTYIWVCDMHILGGLILKCSLEAESLFLTHTHTCHINRKIMHSSSPAVNKPCEIDRHSSDFSVNQFHLTKYY